MTIAAVAEVAGLTEVEEAGNGAMIGHERKKVLDPPRAKPLRMRALRSLQAGWELQAQMKGE